MLRNVLSNLNCRVGRKERMVKGSFERGGLIDLMKVFILRKKRFSGERK